MSFIGMGGFGMATGPASGMRFAQTRGRIQGSPVQGVNYPSPFFDLAHTYLPVTVKALFKWCRYYFLTNPLINAVTFKLSEYPITDVIIDHEDEQVKKRWTEYFQDHLGIRGYQVETGLDYHCLGGDTRVITEGGVVPIRDLAGRTVRVLSEGGVYREASFHFYGKQRLWEVHTEDGVLLATDEHRWPTRDVKQKKIVWSITKYLKNKTIPRTVAPRPEKNEDFWTGVRHGIVFGDGTLSNEGRQAHLILYSSEKRVLARYFDGHCSSISPHREDKYLGVYGLPPSFKELPEEGSSASYWYGFTCGLLSTDGHVAPRDGATVINQKLPDVLLAISARLPWFGMLGGKVREYQTWSNFTKQMEPVNVLTLKKQYLQPEDFIRPDQRAVFEENFQETGYGRFIGIKKVVPTDRVEDVFCCIEPETHSFVIEHGVLTGNCYGNNCSSIGYPFKKWLCCQHCDFKDVAAKIRQHWIFTSNQFRLTCPKCGYIGDALAKDEYIKNASGIKMIRWNPEDIEITYNDITGEYTYFYTIPATVRNDIVIGRKDIVEGVPQVFIQAMREQKGVIFSKENFFHMRRPTLATQDRGWGTPLLLPVLKDTFYLQVMKKAQEAILLEHIVPLRTMFPQAGSGSSDPYTSVNLVDWRDQIAMEIARWRFDSNYIPILPLPIGTQTIGGDGRNLLLTQEIQAWSDQILNGMGVPVEFIRGGMQYAGTNVSMRMMENSFIGYILRLKAQARFIMRQIAAFMDWPVANIRFKPFKMADDLQRKAFLFQLNQANKVSDTTLLADSDLDQNEENQIMIRETDTRLEATKKQQLAMAQIQGEQQLIMMKFQAKGQQVAAQAQQAPVAPGEPGGAEQQQAGGSPGGSEVQPGAGVPQEAQPQQAMPPAPAAGAQQAAGGAGAAAAPPAQGGATQDFLSRVSSQLTGKNRLQQGQAGIDLPGMAMAHARLISVLPKSQQEMALRNLDLQSPELGQLVRQMLASMTPEQEGGGTTDMGPLPNQLPPRRAAGTI